MIKQEYAKFGNQIVHVLHAETIEEAKKEGFPDNIYTCYEINGVREYSPFKIMTMAMQSIHGKTFEPLKIINDHRLKTSHTDLIHNQYEKIVNHYKKIKEEYIKQGASIDIINVIDQEIKKYSENNNIDLDGVKRGY